MRYVEYPASAALAPFVKCHWLVEDAAAQAGDAAEPIVPDGSPELVVHYGAPYERRDAHGRVQAPCRAAFAGQLTAPLWLAPTGATGVLGVRFRPHGAAAFLRVPLQSLRNQVVDAEDVWGMDARHLPEQIHEAGHDAARIAVLERFLLARLDVPRDHAALGQAGRLLAAAPDAPSIDDVAARTGLGRRQLERGFARQVGVAPKQLARILRFQAVFDRLGETPSAAWSALAIDCGYYDQAHLIRDFRSFTGVSPGTWFGDPHALADRFTGLA